MKENSLPNPTTNYNVNSTWIDDIINQHKKRSANIFFIIYTYIK